MVIVIPGGKGEFIEFVFSGIRAEKGIESVLAAIIIAPIAINAERDPSLDLFVPDLVGRRNGGWQNKLGNGKQDQGDDHSGQYNGGNNSEEGYAAGLEGDKLLGVIEEPQGYHPGQKDAYGAHLFKDEGDIEQKILHGQAQGLAFFQEVVVFLKKIDQDVNDDESCHQGEDVLEKLFENIAV